MEQQKRRVAAVLLVLGIFAVIIGSALYQSAKNDADQANHINQLVGERNESIDMMWPLVFLIGGGFSVLCSVILFAGAHDGREEAPPPEGEGAPTGTVEDG